MLQDGRIGFKSRRPPHLHLSLRSSVTEPLGLYAQFARRGIVTDVAMVVSLLAAGTSGRCHAGKKDCSGRREDEWIWQPERGVPVHSDLR